MEPATDRQTVTIAEVAKVLGISRRSAYAYAQGNKLPVPVIRAGHRMFVSKQALDALLLAGKEESGEEE